MQNSCCDHRNFDSVNQLGFTPPINFQGISGIHIKVKLVKQTYHRLKFQLINSQSEYTFFLIAHQVRSGILPALIRKLKMLSSP